MEKTVTVKYVKIKTFSATYNLLLNSIVFY